MDDSIVEQAATGVFASAVNAPRLDDLNSGL